MWKALTAPAHVEARWIPGSNPALPTFEATITPNGEDRLPYHPLHDYRVTWDALDAKGASVQAGTQKFESLASPVQIREEVTRATERTPVRLVLRLIDSNGDLADQRSIPWPPTATPASR